jgi:glutamate N-acetyltransferase / amino-acid N-acetyltransferase
MSYLIKLTKNLPKIHHQIRNLSSKIPESKKHLVPSNGTYPKGFKATGIHCGVKKDGIKDLALIISEKPCTSSAVFTTNVFKAAPVLVSREILEKRNGQNIHSLVINSGRANAVTGTKGLENAKKMSDEVSKLIGVEDSTLVMSTGVIGQHLPIEKIVNGINQAYNDLTKQKQTPEVLHEGWMKAAESITTTDTFPKLRSKQFTLPSLGLEYRMVGTTKGAGMIHPNMATLLATVATDVPISAKALNEALKYAADKSFNAICVDNDMSTNDTFAILANGAATTDGKVIIDDVNGKDFIQFRDDLTEFASDLAKLVVRDGEGATKFITVHVKVKYFISQNNILIVFAKFFFKKFFFFFFF